MQADGGCSGHVERLFTPGLRNADAPGRPRLQCGRDALPFVAQNPGTRPGQAGPVQKVALMHMGDQQRHLQRCKVLCIQPLDQIQPEVRPHAGTQHLGRPERCAALERQHLPKAERRSTAQDGAHIACILHPIQHHGGRAGLHCAGRGQLHHPTHAGR